jgi:uncharacterized LabA/DUF88 family protein
MKKKAFLFIDGSNLYAAQFELFGPKQYLYFPSFISLIEKRLSIRFSKIFFYTSYSPIPKKPTEKETSYLKNEAFFYRSAKQVVNLVFFKGYRSPTSRKEKEVDVKLAVDIVEKASRNHYDRIYLISGDADFMEALFAARRFRKEVNVVCLENKIIYKSFRFFPTKVLVFSNRIPKDLNKKVCLFINSGKHLVYKL